MKKEKSIRKQKIKYNYFWSFICLLLATNKKQKMVLYIKKKIQKKSK